MALDLASATARIARQLRDAEQSIDQTVLKTSELMASMVRARMESDVVVHTGQRALIRLARVQQSLISGSSDLFRVHDEMSGVGIELGIFDEPGSTPKSGLESIDEERQSA